MMGLIALQTRTPINGAFKQSIFRGEKKKKKAQALSAYMHAAWLEDEFSFIFFSLIHQFSSKERSLCYLKLIKSIEF